MRDDPTKRVLLLVADGPEGIEIYTSKDEAVVDWSPHVPALYVVVTIQDAMVKLGPFQMGTIQRQLAEKYGLTGETV